VITAITRQELAPKLAAGAVVLLDAQAPGWYQREHLPGAHPVPYDRIDEVVRGLVPDPATEVVVYCWNAACTASAFVAERLDQLGYTNVRRYVAGKQDWMDAGLPIESADGAGTSPPSR
jgi:rhodanese-related sulfurtransferase